MKRFSLSFLFLLIGLSSFSQPITVNNTTYTVPQLVQDVLFAPGSAGSSCVGTISNISWSTGTDYGSVNGIGYFQNANPNFPLTSGVILSTGNALSSPGPNTSTLSQGLYTFPGTTNTWFGDVELYNYMFGLGIVDTNDDYYNATVLEFDFTPLTNQMSFDFLFASDEYGFFQCTYSDAFAFFLTDVTAGTAAVNLAVVPNTTTPISVTTIRDNAAAGCGAANIAYFGSNNQGANAAGSATNFNGQTALMTANSPVIPNHLYHIKLVISDLNDGSYDSSVFLGGGSFDIGSAEIAGTGEYAGIMDFSGSNAICGNRTVLAQAGSASITGATYSWTFNGDPIPSANAYNYSITQEGNYCVTITFPGGCQQTDCMVVDYINSVVIGVPNDLTECEAPFNLTDNSAVVLNGLTNSISFHHTLNDAQQIDSQILNATNYNGTDGEVIYVAVEDDNTGCIVTTQFVLHIDPSICITNPVPTTPPNISLCENSYNSATATFDLSLQNPIVYGSYSSSDYTISYYTSQVLANSGIGAINPMNSFIGTNGQTIYVRLEENALPTNFGTTSFQLIVNPLPIATISAAPSVCPNETTTVIFNGTPNAQIIFNVDSNPNQTVILNALGTASIITPPLLASTAYNLVSVLNPLTTCSQLQTSSAVVTVSTAPTIFTPTDYLVCDDSLNNDGYYCFDLTTKINEITGGDPNIVVEFFETPTSGVSQSSPYCNIDPSFQTIYVRAYTIGSPLCYSTTTFNLIVNPLPLANPVITDYELCDYNAPGDGFEQFTLSIKTVEIANGQSNVTVSYYETLTDAQTQSNALPNLYTNIVPNTQQIWINIRNNTTGCNTVSSFNLVVNPLPQVTLPDPIFQCSNGATNQAQFDLTLNEGVVTGGVTGLTVTYYNTLLDAQNETSPIATPLSYLGTDNETVYIRVENNTTGCYATTTQLLRVTQGPIAITPQALHYCDPNNDGFGTFNLEDATTEIAGGIWPLVGVSIGYYETETDALLGTNPSLTSPYSNINPWTQTIYVRVFYTLTGCANYVQLQLLVDPTPEATTPDDYLQCDYTGAVGYESFDLTTTIPQILGTIDPSLTTVTFHTSQPDADNNTNAISNLTNYINGTIWVQTLYVRVETIVTGCYDTVTLNLIVNPIPNSLQPNYPQYSLCDYTGQIGFETFDLGDKIDDILLGQTGMSVTFYPSLSDAQNNTNAITNLQYMNEIIYVQTLGVVITNTNTGCYVISTMDIRVEPLPEPIPPTEPYTICDDNQDGYSCEFNLTTLETDILQGAAYILSFYETQTDAEIGDPVSAIDTTVPYCSILPFTQILYVRAQDPLTGCWSVIPVVLNVNPSPIAPVNLNNIIVCDQDSNPQNAITRIDLTQRTADVLAQQPASGSYTVTYYNSQPEAEAGTAPIINDTNYVGTHGEIIWVRVEDTTTNCYNIGSFELEINTPLLLTTPTPLSMCDNDANPNDQHYSFDLTIRDVMITQGLSGYTVAYYPSLTDAQNNTNVITNPTAYINVPPAVQTLGVVVTSTAGCTSITTLDIRVLPVPTPNTNPAPLAPKCDDNNPGDMLEVFDLTVNAAYIANGDPNVTLHYYHSQADALVPQNEIPTPTAALVGDVDPAEQSVWIRVENSRIDYQGNHCAILVEQPLTVNPLPAVVQPLAPYRVCDNDTDGIAFFDLTNPQLATAILGANQLPADYTISYYATAVGANPITNTGETPLPASYQNVTPDAQDIYIRVVNNATGCVNATGILPLAVEEYALATGPQTFASCDDYNDPYDGIYQLDLTQYETAILNGQDPLIFLISYYHTQADAEAGINAIALADAQAYVTTPDTDQIWVKVENSSNTITPVCYALTTIDITVERYPNPIITTQNGVNTICVDFTNNAVVRTLTLNSGITNPAAYTFEWFEDASTTPILGATGPTYTVATASATGATRNYTVRATSISPLLCATTSAAFAVIQSGQAVIPAGTEGYTVTNAFTTSQIITVIVEGYGMYEYSLDDGPRQTSNIFENVPLGPHDIHVWDTEGGVYSCEELVIHNVQIIDYPHYFTPNGDGIHDTWNIVGLDGQLNAKIYIFDRYGKLLKQISSTGTGWDGTYNGQLLPSTDYWFSVDYVEQAVNKQFKAHFSLKR